MTRFLKATTIAVIAVLGIVVSSASMARGGHGHGRVGAFIGGAVIGGAIIGSSYYSRWYYPPYYYNYPPYYYPPVVAVPYTPPVYVENNAQPSAPAPAAAQPQQSWWYYCAQSRAYYPYVSQCAEAWQRVPAQPPNG
jgi:hypothetical protein